MALLYLVKVIWTNLPWGVYDLFGENQVNCQLIVEILQRGKLGRIRSSYQSVEFN
jgi:hypothetical protein